MIIVAIHFPYAHQPRCYWNARADGFHNWFGNLAECSGFWRESLAVRKVASFNWCQLCASVIACYTAVGRIDNAGMGSANKGNEKNSNPFVWSVMKEGHMRRQLEMSRSTSTTIISPVVLYSIIRPLSVCIRAANIVLNWFENCNRLKLSLNRNDTWAIKIVDVVGPIQLNWVLFRWKNRAIYAQRIGLLMVKRHVLDAKYTMKRAEFFVLPLHLREFFFLPIEKWRKKSLFEQSVVRLPRNLISVCEHVRHYART